MAPKEISITASAKSQVIIGVTSGARRVETVDMDTDSATSPLAR